MRGEKIGGAKNWNIYNKDVTLLLNSGNISLTLKKERITLWKE